MIYFPETINTISTTNTISPTHSLVSSWLCTLLTLCMLASWSHEGVVFLDLLPSSHPVTSSLFPYLGSTDAPCSRLGDPVPPSPKWRLHSQGLRTLPYRDPEQVHIVLVWMYSKLGWGQRKPLDSLASSTQNQYVLSINARGGRRDKHELNYR